MDVKDDGLITPEVRSWSAEKHNLVATYAQLFATSMKKKWDCRVYIDLFSGAGRAKIKETQKIILASPLISLGIKDPFNQYIFCEMDDQKIKALKQRVATSFPSSKVSFIEGDVNKTIDEVVSNIPQASTSYKVLSFCFVDPFNINNFKFSTIKKLSDRYVDFIILIPTNMDAERNKEVYFKETSKKLESFFDDPSWRTDWEKEEKNGKGFDIFVADFFGKCMASLGYIYDSEKCTRLIRSDVKNLPLYRLAFFSRNPLGLKFWEEAKKSSNPQLNLFK